MRPHYFEKKADNFQAEILTSYCSFSAERPVAGHLLAVPVVVLDILVDTAKYPLMIIEDIACVAFNLIGMFFSQNYSFKDALYSFENIGADVGRGVLSTVLIPVKLIQQIIKTLIFPTTFSSVSYKPRFTRVSYSLD